MSDEPIRGITVTPLADWLEPYVQQLKRMVGAEHEVVIRAVMETATRNVLRMVDIECGRAARKGISQALALMLNPQYYEGRKQRRKKRMDMKKANLKKPIVHSNRTGRVN